MSGTSPQPEARRLVTVEKIARIESIPGADAIEAAHVRGWTVVVKKGQFEVGEDVVYLEVDAALPLADERFAFLAARGSKVLDGRRVHVLGTVRLRGVYSQGIVLPAADFPELGALGPDESADAVLGVTKWEPALPLGLHAVGAFPPYLHKTDAERVQNLDADTWRLIQGQAPCWRPTEKVDGCSLTAWRTADHVLHVASRNWELDPATSNLHWQVTETSGLAERLGVGEWVQGEVVGPGAQGNRLGLAAPRLVTFGFGTFDASDPALTTTRRAPFPAWPAWVDWQRAPVYDVRLPATVPDAIAQVESLESLLAPGRDAEGIVWTHADGRPLPGLGDRAVWKSISARYLTKHGG